MVFEVRYSRVAPAIASPALTIKAKFPANQPIRIFSQSLCHLDRQPMSVISFCIIARFLKTLYRITGRLSHRHNLKCYYIYLAALYRRKIVGETKAFAFVLPGEEKTYNFL